MKKICLFDKKRYRELKRKIDQLPRINIANLPTPLHEAKSLRKTLGGPRIFFKRDDLTGLALGGNKARMIEFRLAYALNEGADTIIAGYGVQSNHARVIAAACARLGLDCYLILMGDGRKIYQPQGNLLLNQILGAKVKIINGSTSDQRKSIENLSKKLVSEGHKPHITGIEDYHLSAVGYVDCMLEMCLQLEDIGMEPDFFFVSSEGSTQAGLLIASKYLNMKAKIVGITPIKKIDKSWRYPNVVEEIRRITEKAIDIIGVNLSIEQNEVINLSDYVGEENGKLTEGELNAIRLVGNKEGIVLDPVYTGKAMAGLIDKIKKKEIDEKAKVVFVHTGGFPLIIAYSDILGETVSVSSTTE